MDFTNLVRSYFCEKEFIGFSNKFNVNKSICFFFNPMDMIIQIQIYIEMIDKKESFRIKPWYTYLKFVYL